MALVLLPCDLPSWPAVQRHLNQIKNAQNSSQLSDAMQKLHGVCCISLDPDENDKSDPLIFAELQNFLDVSLSDEERRNFFRVVLPSLVSHALRLKQFKPYDGLHYSLQQQADFAELERKFVASLVANAFFSTFPRRTMKTHPTLQDCNFSKSFVHLKSPFQQKKLREILRYFESIAGEEPEGKIVFARQVMSGKGTLDVDDWLSCDRPLCPVVIRHNGKIERAELGTYQVCFSSDRIGGAVLEGGEYQEDLMFCVFPELYVALLFVETLMNNEALTVHGMRATTPYNAPRMDERFGVLNSHVCLIDAADFSADTRDLQYREGDIVREANKAFVGFNQKQSPLVRLPPIGKSFSSTSPENRSETRESRMVKVADLCQGDSSDNPEADPLSLHKMKDLLGQKGGLCGLVDKILSGEPSSDTGDFGQTANRVCGPLRLSRQNLENYGVESSDGPPCPQGGVMQRAVRSSTKSGSSTLVPDSSSRPCPEKYESSLKRLLDREDSDDSVYNDCQEDPDEATEARGLSAQRPLTLKKPLPLPKTTRRHLQVPVSPAKSALDGATGMDSSFISCMSHLSDSSSDGSSEDDEAEEKEEEEEEGFASCAEELDDEVDGRRLVRPKQQQRRLYEIPELPLDLVSPGGRRALASTLQGRLRNSRAEDDAESNFAVDIHIADPDAVPDPSGEFVLRRSASTGFILDEDEDLFLGDGLEHEREWLAQFRHRSAAPSRSSLSRRNSSRYSFSSDFSSDLEDIYEHFEEKMTEGPVRENPAYCGRRSMKRTLSDSLTTFPAARCGLPRSLSLTEKMQEERMNIEQAKQNVLLRGSSGTVVPDAEDAEDRENHRPAAAQPPLVGTRSRPEQSLSEIEDSVTLPFPAWCRRAALAPQMSVWWNYNRVYDFHVPLRGTGFPGLDVIAEASDSTGSDDQPGAVVGPERRTEDGRMLALRRCRSTTEARERRRLDARREFLADIARSLSAEDVKELVRTNADDRSRSEPGRQKPRLKKWQAAGNLSSMSERSCGSGSGSQAATPDPRWLEESKKRPNYQYCGSTGMVADRRKTTGSRWGLLPHESREASEQLADLELDSEGIKPLATGNWGCEEGKGGDPQLKALIQWMAASRANMPFMIYYTGGDQRVVKLNIVCRVLLDRHWSVSHVLRAVLRHCSSRLDKPSSSLDVDLLDSLLPKETEL